MNGVPNALEGIRVTDLSQFAAGPICTLTMAQMGAEVIKVERPVLGEQGRPKGGGQDLNWALLHGNKKSITLNLKTDEGKKILTRLIELSDVLIENYAPGTIERLGFGFERVHEINPRCIFCQIKGYSEKSPYADYPAMDGPVQATGILASQTGLEGSPPIISNVALADDPAGRAALTAILAALFQREKTGRGQAVRINMQELLISMSRMSFSLPREARKRGQPMVFTGKKAPRNMFPTKPSYDGDENNYVFLMVNDTPCQKQWHNFCEAIDRLDLFDDPRFADGEHRFANVDALETEVKKWTTQLDKREAMDILCRHMIPAGATLTVRDIIDSEDMYETGLLQRIHHPVLGDIVVQGSPYRMTDTCVDPVPSPDLGQHNAEIYGQLLGFSDEELGHLKADKVI